jgi:DNA-binding NtrC family response regulator
MNLTSRAILVVEDEPDILNLLQLLIRLWTTEYELLPAKDGETALAYTNNRSIPLVITDYSMPGMNGLQLTTTIKAQTPATQVVLVTAYPTLALYDEAKAQGVDFYLTKPLHVERLEQIVRTALQIDIPSTAAT